MIAVCTPLYGSTTSAKVSVQYTAALLALAKDPSLHVHPLLGDTDLVRSRSRMARLAVEAGADYLLWWDEDVVASADRIAGTLRAMLATGYDFVAAPYPRKRIHWDWAAAAALAGRDVEGSAVECPIITLDERTKLDAVGCVEVAHVGFGFVLMRRAVVEKMTNAFRSSLTFLDQYADADIPTVALFQLMIHPTTRRLLSEDYSFCERWRSIGGRVHLYSHALDHVGTHVFRGGIDVRRE